MPGNLSSATPTYSGVSTKVLPQSLCTAFVESRQYPMLMVTYHDGTPERGMITDGVNAARSLRSWSLGKRLTATQVADLDSFLSEHLGGVIPFYFYNPAEPAPGSAPGSNWDGTGTSTVGRHLVVFQGDWTVTTGLGRSDVRLGLKEVA